MTPSPAAIRRNTALFLLAISSTALLVAFGFQYLGGLAPCEMCWWQRWAHAAVILLALLTLAIPRKALLFLAILAMATSAGLAFYHAGVEQHWWKGITTCTAGFTPGASAEALLAQLRAAPLVRCDAIPWQFLGLSMAAWNALVSAASVFVALLLSRRA